MHTRIEFQTPENVVVSYPLAGAGSRYLAFVIDMLVIGGIYIGSLLIFGLLMMVLAAFGGEAGVVAEANAAILIGTLAVLSGMGFLLYFVLFELFMEGQTPGKRLLRCRVVMERGFALGAGAVIIRGLFRVFEVMPVFWFIPLANAKVQRLGDMAAGTVVVMEDTPHVSPMRALLAARDPERIVYRFGPDQLSALAPGDVEALEMYCERRETLVPSQRDDIATKLVRGLTRRVRHSEPIEKAQEEQFIADLLDAHYRREARELV